MNKEKIIDFFSRYKYLILIIFFIIITCFVGENSLFIRRAAQQREIRELQREIRRLDAMIELNNRLLNSLEQDSYVKEQIARERYKMHAPDEEIFLETPAK
ncbi:MAG: septum formation initiator family protein [Bacteroidaceae bacterium]|nr:septum formation initiator family protein [Bacteroidaceae bacterium]